MSENFKPSNVEGLEENIEHERIKKSIKEMLGMIFDSNNSGPERTGALLKRLEPFLTSTLIEGESIRQSLRELPAIEERGQFVESTFSLLGPFVDLRINHEEEFDRLRPGDTPVTLVNEIFAYGLYENSADIHLGLSGLPMGEIKKLFIEGLKELAKVVNDNKKIIVITGESWIIAKNPGIVEKLGFTIDDKNARSASISREDFLGRYLKE